MKNKPHRSDCPLSSFLDLWGDKWTFIILRDLLDGPAKFKDFLHGREPMPTNILASRLAGLVAEGFLIKTMYSERPKRFEYSLTEKAEGLREVMAVMAHWALDNLPDRGEMPQGLVAKRLKPAAKTLSKKGSKKPVKKTAEPVQAEGAADVFQGSFDF